MSHAEQKATALWDSLSNAGIGKAYHRRSLTEVVAEDSPLFAWVRSPQADIAEGRGWNFIGNAYDAAILTARALHIQGQGTLVLSAHRLGHWVKTNAPQLERVTTVKGLFVTSFYETMHEPPMPGWLVAGVEDLLVERLDDLGSVFLQMERDLDRDGWWSQGFIRKINERNRTHAA